KIRVGDNWRENLAKSIKKARAFLFIMDNNILNSEVANWELETAHMNNVPILPIEVEDIKVHAMFTKQYGNYNRMRFDEEDFEGSMATIIDHIKAIRINELETNKV
ncbi:MAG: toll/interleukin-1 receptor domain-containing protein, partial [Flavisolibacter sp.]